MVMGVGGACRLHAGSGRRIALDGGGSGSGRCAGSRAACRMQITEGDPPRGLDEVLGNEPDKVELPGG